MRGGAVALVVLLAWRAAPAQDSGTGRNPQSAPMEMLHAHAGSWAVMLHGAAFLNNVRASGPRGGEKTFSTNWLMASAQRPVGGGTLILRSMLSLEPATISGRKYPELFQTGETAFGKQLIDAQHPHDGIMELAAEYSRDVRGRTLYVYAAPVGEPAIGPVAFPHRASAEELPQAPIGHHFEDSTHIAFNVVTAGLTAGLATVEASAFHGGEPDERRWNIDGGRIDSFAARLRLQPTQNIDVQVSHAHLVKPERIEPGYAKRTTASISYNLPLARAEWSSSIVWGQIFKEVHDRTLNAWLGETVLHLGWRHHITARAESVDKDELFPHAVLTVVPRPPLPIRIFRVQSYTVSYTFDFARCALGRLGAGGNVTSYRFPQVLNGFYGEKPHSVMLYLRARLGARM